MKCDAGCKWDEEASIFFSYIEEGKVRKVNLCTKCAEERGVNDPTGYSLIDMLQGMGEETSSGKREIRGDELTCAACGFTQSDFKKTGRFGCANCYEVFNEGLENLLEAMHKNTEHIGKVPSFVEESMAEQPEEKIEELEFDFGMDFGEVDEISEIDPQPGEVNIAMLKDSLDVAISAENYEEAARLRDQISKLEAEGFGNS